MRTGAFNAGIVALLSFTIVATVFFALAMSALADTISVRNTNDSGPRSLHGAIAVAGDGDTIQFDPVLKGQTITRTSGELFINNNLMITGPGPSQLTVESSTAGGTPPCRIFHILKHTVTIEGLSITNGLALGLGNSPDAGGGIFCDDEEQNNETLAVTMSNCVISGNTAGGPGGFGGGGGISFGAINCFGPSTLTVNGRIDKGSFEVQRGPTPRSTPSPTATVTSAPHRYSYTYSYSYNDTCT